MTGVRDGRKCAIIGRMKQMLLATLVLAGLAFAGCRRTDVRDFSVSVPGLTEADVPLVKSALAPYGGVVKTSIRFDAAAQRVTLQYDSMQIAQKNIEMAIAKAGFTANGVTPESIGAKRK